MDETLFLKGAVVGLVIAVIAFLVWRQRTKTRQTGTPGAGTQYPRPPKFDKLDP